MKIDPPKRDKRSKRDERLGQVFINKYGTPYKIIEYNNTTSVVVEFMDEYKHRVHTNYYWAEQGAVKNPFDRTVYGVGFHGIVPSGNHDREYSVWNGMLRRCYATNGDAYKEKAEVWERWHCFAHFLEDMPKIEEYNLWKNNPNQRIALDKDVKGQGQRLYSLETCCFVTVQENSKERNERKPPKTRPIKGVNIETGEVLHFSSTSSLTDHGFTRSAVMGVCNGKYKQHKGYIWNWEE